MRGIHFRALMSLAEERFGPEVVEQMLDRAGGSRRGAYTTVGFYPPEEFLALAEALSDLTGQTRQTILFSCGRRVYAYLRVTQVKDRPPPPDILSALRSIASILQASYKKLHNDAVLPSIEVEAGRGGRVDLIYRSPRPMADFAEGLVHEALAPLQADCRIDRLDLPPFDGRAARFRVTPRRR